MKAKMTVVKSPRLDAEEAASKGEKPIKPLDLNELLALIGTKGTVREREQVVIENLKRRELHQAISERTMK